MASPEGPFCEKYRVSDGRCCIPTGPMDPIWNYEVLCGVRYGGRSLGIVSCQESTLVMLRSVPKYLDKLDQIDQIDGCMF